MSENMSISLTVAEKNQMQADIKDLKQTMSENMNIQPIVTLITDLFRQLESKFDKNKDGTTTPKEWLDGIKESWFFIIYMAANIFLTAWHYFNASELTGIDIAWILVDVFGSICAYLLLGWIKRKAQEKMAAMSKQSDTIIDELKTDLAEMSQKLLDVTSQLKISEYMREQLSKSK
jgi:hypothetical protein